MSSLSDERGPVELLADEFLARCKRGEKPTITEYCDRHPRLADEIRDVFEAVLMVEDLKPGSSDVSGPDGESVQVARKRLQQVGDYRILCEIGRGGRTVLESMRKPAPLDLYNLTCAYAQLSVLLQHASPPPPAAERDALADKAIDTLRRSLAAGWKDFALLDRDHDLDPLRGRPDFPKLSAEAKSGAKTKTKE